MIAVKKQIEIGTDHVRWYLCQILMLGAISYLDCFSDQFVIPIDDF